VTRATRHERALVALLRVGGALTLFAAFACDARDPIARIEDERRPASAELIEASRDPDPKLRARAVLAMGRIQSAAYVGPLLEAAGDDDPPVRLAAFFALGQLGLLQGGEVPEAAATRCLEGLADGDSAVVVRAVEALGKLADPGAPAALAPLFEDPRPEVRAEVAIALFRCRFAPVWRGEADGPAPLPPLAIEALFGALGDPDPSVRRAVVYSFSRYGQAKAAGRLARFVRDEDEWTRLFAVRAIGRSGGVGAAEAVVAALDDPSGAVRTEAVDALAALDRAGLLPPSLAADGSFHVRAALARALGGGEGSLDLLRELAGDGSISVRAAAIASLARRLGEGYAATL